MKTIQEKITDFLEIDGWEVHKLVAVDLPYWANDIWKLTSLWFPEGSTAFLTFLITPQADRIKMQKVWSIGCSKDYPITRLDAESNRTIIVHSMS
jgi:hypothetical protein